MWARREILPEHHNAQGPILPWQSPFSAAPQISPEEAPVPTIYVDTNKRRDVEAFAYELEELGAPPLAPPEALAYARMDASALLAALAGPDLALLDSLKAAVKSKNKTDLCDILDEKKVGSRAQRMELRSALQNGDKRAAADSLRRLAQPNINAMMARSGGRPQMAMEIAGPHDPLMQNERRMQASVYMTGNPTYPKSFQMRRPLTQEGDPIAYANMQLGYDAAAWEQDCLFHAYMYDCANAQLDLVIESMGTGYLDGRLMGDRPFGPTY